MANLIAFVNQFLEYLVVFGAAVVLVLIGVFAGIYMRKRKDAKESAS
ncbi:MAG: vanadium nitrogenase [Lachnospiraceae bacterium]|nr:vanadium nitrogenase [Lachnospiraceae bacterium]